MFLSAEKETKKSKEKYQSGGNLVCCHPTNSPLLKPELQRQCGSENPPNLRHAAAIALVPPEISVCFFFFDCQ